MPFVFKSKKEVNQHSLSISYFKQTSSDNEKVKMENLDEQLKISIKSILKSISEDTVNGIIAAVKYAGLESLLDLQFVQEEDLILVLMPIQRRKLVKAWSEQNKTDKKKQTIKTEKIDNLSQVNSVAPAFSATRTIPDANTIPVFNTFMQAFNTTLPATNTTWPPVNTVRSALNTIGPAVNPTISATNKTMAVVNSTATQSERCDEGSLEGLPVAEMSDLPLLKWKFRKLIRLLKVYAKYKTGFSCSGVEEQSVWRKITSEARKKCSLNLTESHCINKIEELKDDYEKLKNKDVTSQETAIFLDEAKNAFETTESTVNFSCDQSSGTVLRNCKKKKQIKDYHVKLLEVYAKYKTELPSPDIEEMNVWEKIAREMRETFSYNCGGYFCRFELLQLKCHYENLKKRDVKIVNLPYFFDKAQKAFETTEYLDNLNSSVEVYKNVNKYVPPHIRNGKNVQETTYTVKVSNLSNRIKDTDVQELFKPFGTIGHIYIDKDKSGLCKGVAFIRFYKQEDATRAVLTVDGHVYDNLTLKVDWAEFSETSKIF